LRSRQLNAAFERRTTSTFFADIPAQHRATPATELRDRRPVAILALRVAAL
jgi:hypothetical protein